MRCKDLIGKKYNMLTVLNFSHMDVNSYWKVKCDCGQEFITKIAAVVSGDRKSCGCFSGYPRMAEKTRLINRNSTIASALRKLEVAH